MKSKRYKNLLKIEKDLSSKPLKDLLTKIKKNCTTKFDESIDLNLQINNKQKKGEVNIRTIVNMPSGTGKKIKVAVLCEDGKKAEAEKVGADMVGGDDLIEKIKGGELNFEKLICTPGMMIKLSKLGKVLGPKGLMPNPKTGTVSDDVTTAIKNVKAGQIRFRTDKNGIIHGSIGKVSFDGEKIKANASALLEELRKLKPASAKGVYIGNIAISSTMGPGVKINPGELV